MVDAGLAGGLLADRVDRSIHGGVLATRRRPFTIPFSKLMDSFRCCCCAFWQLQRCFCFSRFVSSFFHSFFLSCCVFGQVVVWDASALSLGVEIVYRLQIHTREVNGLDFNSDASLLCSGSLDHLVAIWDMSRSVNAKKMWDGQKCTNTATHKGTNESCQMLNAKC